MDILPPKYFYQCAQNVRNLIVYIGPKDTVHPVGCKFSGIVIFTIFTYFTDNLDVDFFSKILSNISVSKFLGKLIEIRNIKITKNREEIGAGQGACCIQWQKATANKSQNLRFSTSSPTVLWPLKACQYADRPAGRRKMAP